LYLLVFASLTPPQHHTTRSHHSDTRRPALAASAGIGLSTRSHWSHSRHWQRNSRSTCQNSSATTRLLENSDLAA